MKRKRSYGKNHKQVSCYGDGGPVRKPKPPAPAPKPTPDPNLLGSGAASKAGEILRDRRRKQMEELGI
jgi:hypothetical protein